MNGFFRIQEPKNEKVMDYKKGSEEREKLSNAINKIKSGKIEIPLIIDGKEVYTENKVNVIAPHEKSSKLAVCNRATESEIKDAIEASMKAKKEWEKFSWEERVSIFLKAAELLATKYRYIVNAATMLGQSKTIHQAEIDSAAEMIDFLRFNAYFMKRIYEEQPLSSVSEINMLDYRPLDGFVFAITPFNFTSIGGNLPSSPAMMGNTVIWKPASTAVLSNYYLMKIFIEAGLPAGVINFLPGRGSKIGKYVINDKNLNGIHFTGSTGTFNHIYKQVADNLDKYKSYPRIVGETGGKDFVFVHESADIHKVSVALVRGAFEYQGQKCSAASRAYIPESLYDEIMKLVKKYLDGIKMGNPENFENFVSAVIDENAYEDIKSYIDHAKKSKKAEIIAGGNCDKSRGFFIEPTVIKAKQYDYKTMKEEIFGPVLTVYRYKNKDYEKTLDLCNEISPYGLTGAIFAQDRNAVRQADKKLRFAAGNFYINDKPTGAVVGRQPFGGARKSGTNDKAGSILNLIRWTNPRNISESFNAPENYRYPYMD